MSGIESPSNPLLLVDVLRSRVLSSLAQVTAFNNTSSSNSDGSLYYTTYGTYAMVINGMNMSISGMDYMRNIAIGVNKGGVYNTQNLYDCILQNNKFTMVGFVSTVEAMFKDMMIKSSEKLDTMVVYIIGIW